MAPAVLGWGEWWSTAEPASGWISGVGIESKAVRYAVVEGRAIFEGDIVLGSAEELGRSTKQPKGLGIPGAQYRWPQRNVPFVIASTLPDPGRVRRAIDHWRERSVMTFVERTPANEGHYPDYLAFEPASTCSSKAGRRGGRQVVTLSADGHAGNAIHEIGHAVGLWHEQSRADRANYVRYRPENVLDGFEHNFDQHIKDGEDLGAYDYASIMHYPANAFSKNGRPTLEALGGQPIGQREAMSQGDVAAVALLYAGI